MLGTYFILVYKKSIEMATHTYPRLFWIHPYIRWIISLQMLGTYFILVYKKVLKWQYISQIILNSIHSFCYRLETFILCYWKNMNHQYPKIWDIWNTKMATNSTIKMWHLWSHLFSKAWNNWFVENKKYLANQSVNKLHIYEIIVVSFMNLN